MAERNLNEVFPSNSNRSRYGGDGTGIIPTPPSTNSNSTPAPNVVPDQNATPMTINPVGKVKQKGEFGRKLIDWFFDQDIYNEDPKKYFIREIVKPGFRDMFWTFVNTMLGRFGTGYYPMKTQQTQYTSYNRLTPYSRVSPTPQAAPQPVQAPSREAIISRQIEALNLSNGLRFATEKEASDLVNLMLNTFNQYHVITIGYLAQNVSGFRFDWAQQDALGWLTIDGLHYEKRGRDFVVFFPPIVALK